MALLVVEQEETMTDIENQAVKVEEDTKKGYVIGYYLFSGVMIDC
jgi:hypothetical protein